MKRLVSSAVILLLACYILSGCFNKEADTKFFSNSEWKPVTESNNSAIYYFNEDASEFILKEENMIVYKKLGNKYYRVRYSSDGIEYWLDVEVEFVKLNENQMKIIEIKSNNKNNEIIYNKVE